MCHCLSHLFLQVQARLSEEVLNLGRQASEEEKKNKALEAEKVHTVDVCISVSAVNPSIVFLCTGTLLATLHYRTYIVCMFSFALFVGLMFFMNSAGSVYLYSYSLSTLQLHYVYTDCLYAL